MGTRGGVPGWRQWCVCRCALTYSGRQPCEVYAHPGHWGVALLLWPYACTTYMSSSPFWPLTVCCGRQRRAAQACPTQGAWLSWLRRFRVASGMASTRSLAGSATGGALSSQRERPFHAGGMEDTNICYREALTHHRRCTIPAGCQRLPVGRYRLRPGVLGRAGADATPGGTSRALGPGVVLTCATVAWVRCGCELCGAQPGSVSHADLYVA